HGDTCGLDLAIGEPAGLEGLEAVVAELHGRLGTGEPAPAATVLLAVLDALRGQHQRLIPPDRSGRSRPPRPPPRPPWPPRPPGPPPPPPRPPWPPRLSRPPPRPRLSRPPR